MTRTPARFASHFDSLGGLRYLGLALSVGLVTSCVTEPDGGLGVEERTELTNLTGHTGKAGVAFSTNPDTGEAVEHTGVCSGGRFHCFARMVTQNHGQRRALAAVMGFGPPDIQAAYNIDVNAGANVTIAIVDAYGYSTLEADLGVYRSQYGLPACTTANGCLKIVNQSGQTSPLPANPPADDDWTVETALDVDMVSAACPKCKILVVQATNNQGDGLYVANNTAAALHATAVSNSWGAAESGGEAGEESYFDHAGIAIFVSAGDDGYNDGGQGPDYPATSSHAIAVGGTSLRKTTTGRGYSEVAWSIVSGHPEYGAGGSACSLSIPKPSYQPANSGCQYKATADVAAVGDPATGLAIYDSNAGGWQVIGGTSASSPMVAAMFAGAGFGNMSGSLIYQNAAKFNDVLAGTNGTCGTILCKAGAGWDGPTGVGTPNMQAIKGGGGTTGNGPTVSITSPADGASVGEGFSVTANVGANATSAELWVDGAMVMSAEGASPTFTAPSDLTLGAHTVEVRAYDASSATTTTTINVTVSDSAGGGGTAGGDNDNDVIGGCAAGGASGGLGAMLALGAVLIRRRRR